MKKPVTHRASSVRARLANLARNIAVDFDLILLRYLQERFICRLSETKHAGSLILKGGVLLFSLQIPSTRPTKDIDFPGYHIKNDPATLKKIIEEIVTREMDDGVQFDLSSLSIEKLMEETDYEGLRIKLNATLEQARKTLFIDVGFGDVVVPGATDLDFPVLLGGIQPRIRAYSLETLIAEKFEAMIKRGTYNSRMKDFYDIYLLSMTHTFEASSLLKAIKAMLQQRETSVLPDSIVFKDEFRLDEGRRTQWKAFLAKSRLHTSPEFKEIMIKISNFLMPLLFSNESMDAKKWDNAQGRWLFSMAA